MLLIQQQKALYVLCITNKTERFSFKTVCVLWVSKCLVHSVAVAIAAQNNFVLLLKSFIVNVLKCKACLKLKLKCVYITMHSLVMSPFSCD